MERPPACNLFMDKVPGPLFFLRYNLFLVLYPSGISGEVLQMYASLSGDSTSLPILYGITRAILFLYTHAGPFMIFFMWLQRTGATKKRAMAGRKPRPIKGVAFPITNKEKNERSTTLLNRRLFADATEASGTEEGADAAESMRKTKNWRFGYVRHVVKHVEVALTSEEAALNSARAGLAAAHDAFEFVREGLKEGTTLAEAMASITDQPFATAVIEGNKEDVPTVFQVPYKSFHTGKDYGNLEGEELHAQLDKWVEAGTIEPSSADALKMVADNGEKFLDLRDHWFVLLGTGSAMGPYRTLIRHGANIIAVDVPFANWKELIALARDSPGTLYVPCLKPTAGDQATLSDAEFQDQLDEWAAENNKDTDGLIANVAGSNLLEMTPEVKNWVLEVSDGHRITIGNHTYLDGEMHVRLSVACDAIISACQEARSADRDVGCAFLCSPTDVFLHPEDAIEQVKRYHKNAPLWQKIIAPLFGMKRNVRKPVKCDDGEMRTAVDGLVTDQGPNYALAKRIQHWRVMVSRADGYFASSNIAPSSATASVLSNKTFAIAYVGQAAFGAMEIVYAEVPKAVMGGLLLHDLINKKSKAQPQNVRKLKHPMETFGEGAFHGGVWRTPFVMRSSGAVSFLVGFAKTYGLVFSVVEAALVALVMKVTEA